MFEKHNTDVLVAGAGPVGSVAALFLREQGVEFQLLDKAPREAAQSYALALHPYSLEILDRLGLADPVLSQGHRIDRIVFYDEKQRRAEIDLGELPSKCPHLLVIPQAVLEKVLHDRLAERKVEVHWNHRVTAVESVSPEAVSRIDKLGQDSLGYIIATTAWVIEKTYRLHSRFIIGADGHRSVVRESAGLKYQDLGESKVFAVFEFSSSVENPGNAVRILLGDDHTDVLWPLPGGRFRWSFEIQDWRKFLRQRSKSLLPFQAEEDVLLQETREKLAGLIRERAPWFDAEIGTLHWSDAVRFDRRLVNHFGHQQVWLAGDAAHLALPIGVHSMNVGLREAEELSDAIGKNLRDPGTTGLLAAYERHWKRDWERLLGVSDGLQFGPETIPWVRQHAERMVGCLPASGDHLKPLAGQLGIVVP